MRIRIENIVLIAVGIVIAVAAIYDLTREVRVDNRLTADIETWRSVTGIHDEEVAIEQDLASYTTRDTACGNVTGNKEFGAFRICLMMAGPISGGHRKVLGGFYLPPYLSLGPNDRYGCFGSKLPEHFCAYTTRPGMPSGTPKGFHS